MQSLFDSFEIPLFGFLMVGQLFLVSFNLRVLQQLNNELKMVSNVFFFLL